MNWRESARRVLPRGYKPHVIRQGPLQGKRIVTSWRDYPAAIRGYAELELTKWLLENVRLGETWLDVGAHYGYTSLAMCERVGSGGRVFAFEPTLSTAGCLERTRTCGHLWQWTILPFALSNHPQLTLLQSAVIRGMIDSQISVEQADGMTQMLAVNLDSLWKDISGANSSVHGIKMDVQGMELEALKGMKGLLSQYRPKVVLEIHAGVSRQEVITLLEECGYQPEPTPLEKPAADFFDVQSNQSFIFTT